MKHGRNTDPYRVVDLRKFFFGRAWTERASTDGENAFFPT
jgi:hypothetical protein